MNDSATTPDEVANEGVVRSEAAAKRRRQPRVETMKNKM
jgi:hypothetical protein